MLFFIGAFAMRGAGCTWNDIVDRDLDGLSRAHPLAAAPVGPSEPAAAPSFLVLQALVGFLVLIQFNRFAIATGIASLGDRRGLSVHEADHLLAADRARARVLLGRADGLGRQRSAASMPRR